MEITVIVTVHNAEKYLRECLESIIRQTFSDIEILCMDGGSIDASPRILREYAEKDNRIRIIDDPDTGYGHKVNEGIGKAAGKYISVLESDDIYMENMLEKLYAVMEQYDVDYANGDYIEFTDVGSQRFYMLRQMYEDEDYGRLQQSGKHPEKMRQIARYWTGMFKRDFLLGNNIRMNESPGASFQDLSFRFLTSALAETSYHLKEAVYLYRSDNPDSSVHDPRKAAVTADEYAFLKGELEKRKIINPFIWQHFYTWKYKDFYANMARFQGDAREALFHRSYRELEIDRGIMEKNGYGKSCGTIWDFLTKPKEEIAEEITERYQAIRQENCKRRTFYEKIGNRPFILFGCGAWGRNVLKSLYQRERQILCCTDNAESLWGQELGGIKIEPPAVAADKYRDVLFVIARRSLR